MEVFTSEAMADRQTNVWVACRASNGDTTAGFWSASMRMPFNGDTTAAFHAQEVSIVLNQASISRQLLLSAAHLRQLSI